MTTAAQLVSKAASQVGVTERGYTNDVKFNDWYYGGGYPSKYQDWAAWCATFTSWCADQVGLTADVDYPKTAGVAVARSWAQKHGRWVKPSQIRKGDLVVYLPHFSHIGIAREDARGGVVKTIEGNTSPTSAGSQRDGGGVWKRTRSLSLVGGGIRLNYTTSKPAADAARTEGPFGMTVTNTGRRTKNVGLKAGKYVTIPINNDGDVSILTGLKKGDSFLATCDITLDGLTPGTEVRARFYYVNYRKGHETTRGYVFPSQEVIGTGGSSSTTLVRMDVVGSNAPSGWDRRLRLEVCAYADGVTVTDANFKTAR